MPSPQRDDNLRPFATDRQWEYYEAYWELGTNEAVAQRFGVRHQVVSQALKMVDKKAAAKGYAPGTQWHVPGGLPEGYALKGQSSHPSGRWDKSTREGLDPDEAVQMPDPFTLKRLATHTGPDGRVIGQWSTKIADLERRKALWEHLAERLTGGIAPLEPAPSLRGGESKQLTIYNIGDHHNGMYAWHEESGENWDLDLASDALRSAMARLTDAAPSTERALVTFLGDFFDYDGMEPVTPEHKNLLDVDGRFCKMAEMGMDLMIDTVRAARQRHEFVDVIPEAGNHDPSTMRLMALFLKRLFANDPNVQVDTSPSPFKYYVFGKNLNGICHGHEVKKLNDLALIMALDRADDWAKTLYRYWWTGHVHKDQVVDEQGVRIESCAVLCPTNAWAHGKGYRGKRSMQAVIQDYEYGESERLTVNPRMFL